MRFIATHIAAACFVVVSPCVASADDGLSLYQAMEIVTGTDMRERPRGFAMCLEDVLIKVSGDPRLRADPRVAEAKRHANEYVTSFNYVDPIAGTRPKDDQGTYDRSENLTVTFDPAKIDALLVSLGDPPWREPRPVLVPVLSVHGRKPPDYLLTATEPLAAEQRASFERVAGESGLALKFPTPAEFEKSNVGEAPAVNAASCGAEGTIIVRGMLNWSEAARGWVGIWHTCWQERQHSWSVQGVGYDQAFLNIVQGAVLLAAGRGVPEALATQTH